MDEINQINEEEDIGMKDENKTFYEILSENQEIKERSKLSKKGGIKPYSLYTRRVININNIRCYLQENSTHGLCGNYNLGNTCFMNSSIACLSNCLELTVYFLSGDYLKDINRTNKLGMGGKLAEIWGNLLQEYWILHTRVGEPSELKNLFGEKVNRFRGNSQQDANEFIDLFLDYLNEDLNAVTNKEYLQLKEKGENETDKKCAKRFWDNYLKRNDSIVTDLFCGQLKCTISCPECQLINITFDPFNTLNLNIPEKRKNQYRYDYLNNFTFFYVPKYYLRTPIKIVFRNIPKNVTFKDLFRCLKKEKQFKYHKNINKLIINKISDKKSIKFINQEDDSAIENYDDSNYYFSYDILDENENIRIPLYFKDNKGLSIFPRIIMIKEDSNLDDLRKKIYYNIRKLILSPLKKENEVYDKLSEEIIEYSSNIEIDDNYIFEYINKEYNIVFNNDQEKNEEYNEYMHEYIQNFIEDIPFNIYLTRHIKDEFGRKIYIIDKNHFTTISSDFTDLTGIQTYKDSIKELLNLLKSNHYYIVLEFQNYSNYINKKLYKLNNCIKNICDYSEEEDDDEGNNETMTLKKLLELFTKEEKLKEGDEWYCPRCKKHVLAKKKMDIFYAPKILIICFKRFIKHSFSWERNDELINFPIVNFDMKEFIIGPDKERSKYDLFAVNQHYGGTGFGHYTAVCKNLDRWYCYNDSSVNETSPDKAVSSSAYILFYRRQTD